MGWEVFQLNELSTARETGFKPVGRNLSDASAGKSIEEGDVRNGIKGCTQIVEDEDVE